MASAGEGIVGPPEVIAAVEEASGVSWNDFVDLLLEIDTRLISEGRPPKARPLVASFEIGRRLGRPVVLSGLGPKNQIVEAVHRIYELIYGARNLQVGPAHVGAIMIRDVFYEVFVPMAFGEIRLEFWDYVAELDKLQLNMFHNVDPADYPINTDQLIDIFDFGYAAQDLLQDKSRWCELIRLSREQIEAACRTLQGSFSHRVAVQGVAYAVELAGKALLSKNGASESDTERLKHNLPRLVTEIAKTYPHLDHNRLFKSAAAIPYVISERYNFSDLKRKEIGLIIRHGQFMLGEFARGISTRNMRLGMSPRLERKFP